MSLLSTSWRNYLPRSIPLGKTPFCTTSTRGLKLAFDHYPPPPLPPLSSLVSSPFISQHILRRPKDQLTTEELTAKGERQERERRGREKGPLVILHGLFGSKQNWTSLGKRLGRELGREVYVLVSLPSSLFPLSSIFKRQSEKERESGETRSKGRQREKANNNKV